MSSDSSPSHQQKRINDRKRNQRTQNQFTVSETSPENGSPVNSLTSSTSQRKRLGASSVDSKGFSRIKSMTDLQSRFNLSYHITTCSFKVERENSLSEIPLPTLMKLTSSLVVAEKVVFINGEKSLYFPVYDLIKLPLLMSNLKFEVTEDVPKEGTDIDEDEDKSQALPEEVDNSSPWIHYDTHEETLSDSRARGPVEFLIKSGDDVILAIEMKRLINLQRLPNSYNEWEGFFQLLAQLTVAIDRNKNKKKIVYGALSDFTTGVFVKMEKTEMHHGSNGKPDIEVFLSSPIPILRLEDDAQGWLAGDLPLFYSYLFQILLEGKGMAGTAHNMINMVDKTEEIVAKGNQYFHKPPSKVEMAIKSKVEMEIKSKVEMAIKTGIMNNVQKESLSSIVTALGCSSELFEEYYEKYTQPAKK